MNWHANKMRRKSNPFYGPKIKYRYLPVKLSQIFREFIYYSEKEKCLSKYTIAHYNYYINMYLYFLVENRVPLSISAFTSLNLTKFFNYLSAKSGSPSYIYAIFYKLKTFIKYCVTQGYIKDYPYLTSLFPRRSLSKVMTIEHGNLRKIFNMLKKIKDSNRLKYLRNSMIIDLSIYAGLRPSEILKIKISDINILEGHIKIRKGKTKRERSIPLNIKILKLIKQYLSIKKSQDHDYLIVNLFNNKPLTYHALGAIVRRLVRSAGIKRKITSYTLRHSFASRIIKNGGSMDYLKVLMGHTKLNMTAHYVHIPLRHLRKTINNNPILPECNKLFDRL